MPKETILHDGSAVMDPGGPGTVDGIPVFHDFGERIDALHQIRVTINNVTDPGSFGWQLAFQSDDNSSFSNPDFVFFLNSLFTGTELEPRPTTVSLFNAEQFLRVFFFAFGGAGSVSLEATIFDEEIILVQEPLGVVDANSYDTVAEAEERISRLLSVTSSYADLSESRKSLVLIYATRRIELEAVRLCQPKGSSLLDPETQPILWPRENAFSIHDIPIDFVLESWRDAIALYSEEVAAAESLGEEAEEPAEDAGFVELQLDAFGAQYRERWGKDGSPADFFQPRQRILALLSESFPDG